METMIFPDPQNQLLCKYAFKVVDKNAVKKETTSGGNNVMLYITISQIFVYLGAFN